LIENERKKIKVAIKSLCTGRSPGIDGLTAEFFQHFKAQFTVIMFWLWREIENKNLLPKNLRLDVTSLIYKKGTPSDLNDWRPITMSNVEYKVIAIVLKLRLLPVLPLRIGPYQTCNVPGRSIFDNLSFIRNNMEFDGAIMSIDQAGAFNNVDHQYMLKVFAKYGFPEFIQSFIRILYSNILILVNVGGDLVGPIEFQKGVKQGDPVASILYILAFQPFLRKVHRKMLEIKLNPFSESPETNISSYADDVNLFVSDKAQIEVIEEELMLFGRYSAEE
jgi:hypothetical protein